MAKGHATALDALIGEISDSELSRRSGVARETLRRIRRGKHHPRFNVVERLALALGLENRALAEAIASTVAAARREARS